MHIVVTLIIQIFTFHFDLSTLWLLCLRH